MIERNKNMKNYDSIDGELANKSVEEEEKQKKKKPPLQKDKVKEKI